MRSKERSSMGFIEEGRQRIQDFVTPEIRSLDARLTAVEKRLESLDARVEKRFDSVDKRFDSFENSVDKRFNSLEGKIERNQAQVLDTLQRMENYSQILERLARVESKLQNVA
jgi:tetrahydromethanopterin S-methyltransferase subunit G